MKQLPSAMATSSVSQSSVEDWKYIAEGGSTIVFAYVGPAHQILSNKVLRLRKVKHETVGVQENAFAPPLVDLDDPAIVFQHTIIRRLVPEEFLPPLEVVSVDKEWVRLLAEATEAYRPEARRLVDRIDLSRETAVLADNLVGSSGLAVEIKPKWGFLPRADHLSPDTRPVKTRTCRFCMHAHAKGASQKDVPLGFCPLDLYSGDEQRLRRALSALWVGWIRSDGGINNLRIFADGRVLKPSSDIPSLHSSLTTATARPAPSLDALQADFVEVLLPILLGSPVLRLLSFRQRSLDPLDIEGLASLWRRIYADDPRLGDGAAEPTLEEWTRFVDAYLARCEDAGVAAKPEEQHRADEAELRQQCLAYLLSATFKDCSIVIRFMPSSGFQELSGGVDDDHMTRQDTPLRVAAHAEVKLIDLDVKSIKRLAKWEKLDRDIVSAYARLEDPRICIDSLAGMRLASQCTFA